MVLSAAARAKIAALVAAAPPLSDEQLSRLGFVFRGGRPAGRPSWDDPAGPVRSGGLAVGAGDGAGGDVTPDDDEASVVELQERSLGLSREADVGQQGT